MIDDSTDAGESARVTPSIEGKRIQAARDARGLSAHQLANLVGVGKNTIAQIESGATKSPTVETVRRIAAALGVTPGYIIDGETDPAGPSGFGESELAAWEPKRSGQRPDHHDRLMRVPAALAPNAGHLATQRLTHDLPGFNFEAGDVLVIDIKALPQTGDLVMATVADFQTGTAHTILRRYVPPYLVPGDSSRSSDVVVVDNARTVISGKVVASFRAPQLD